MNWPPAQHLSEIAERLAAFVTDMADGKRVGWLIRKLDETSPCGWIDLRISGDEGDVSHVLAASKWDQGIMTEALTAVLQFAHRHLSLRRIRRAGGALGSEHAFHIPRNRYNWRALPKGVFAKVLVSHNKYVTAATINARQT
jgi:hypothetical protein